MATGLSRGKIALIVSIVLALAFGLVFLLVNIAGKSSSTSNRSPSKNLNAGSDTAVESLTSISAVAAGNKRDLTSAVAEFKKVEAAAEVKDKQTKEAIDGVAEQVNQVSSALLAQIAEMKKELIQLRDKEDVQVGVDPASTALIWIEPSAERGAAIDGGSNNPLSAPASAIRGLRDSTAGLLGQGFDGGGSASTLPISLGVNGSQVPHIEPVYTIPKNATLTNATSLTSLIGRVPIGTNVRFPIRFKVITGADNLISNNKELPGIKEAVWSGYAVGDRVLECVRGVIDSVTFTFDDGRIATVPSEPTDSNANLSNFNENRGIGWISDPTGNCIKGEYVTNAPENLQKLFISGFAEGASRAAAASQLTLQGNGLSSTLSGNSLEFAAGNGLSEGLDSFSDFIAERAREDFDVIYVESGQEIVINITNSVNIDYDFGSRKIEYFNQGGINNDLH